MTRRDTIIVAVLLNATVIAILLMMAITTDDEILQVPPERTFELAKEALPNTEDRPFETMVKKSEGPIVIDLEAIGFDNMLSDDFNSSSDDLFLLDDDLNGLSLEKPLAQTSQSLPKPARESNETIVEIVVKKGDSLDKIARANNTTIEEIKRATQLKSEKLSIGQLLKVPVGSKKSTFVQVANNDLGASTKAAVPTEAVYYVVKSGDNPWKIAKQQQVDMDDLLRLNHLNEEKARNLKPGDKIRIR